MYKVFVNESLLCFSDRPVPGIHTDIRPEKTTALVENLLTGQHPAGDFRVILPEAEAETFLRTHFEPVPAAGGIVLDAQKRILWIFRRGKWDLPKGKADEGESTEETALREVREECGISDLRIVKYLGPCHHLYGQRPGKKAAFKTTYWYLMETQDATFVPQTEEDITEIRFFDRENPDPFRNTFRSISDFLETHYR